MNNQPLYKEIKAITDLLSANRFWEAIQMIRPIIIKLNVESLSNSLEKSISTYTNILKYSLDYTNDPEKYNIYYKLARDLFELCDQMKEHVLMNSASEMWNQEQNDNIDKKSATSETTQGIIDILFTLHEKAIREQKAGSVEYELKMTDNIRKTFDIVWKTHQLKKEDSEAFSRLMTSDFPWYIKSLAVSALTISAFFHFDTDKINLLIKVYLEGEDQIWHRAAVGLFLLLMYYEKRLMFYPEIVNRIKSIPDFKVFQKHIEAIYLQFLKAQETEKITKKIQDEIIPEVMKMKTDLEDKLNLKELLSSETFEDKNPDWENVFKDSPDVYNKLEEFSMLQMEGSDVFMSAFGMLKKFDFFHYMSNWFIPFYKENILIDESLQSIKENFDVNTFIEGMERSTVLCNSDKYSFCLNIKHMPDMQKSMMLELFNMELKAMNEMANEEHKHNINAKNKVIFTQYIQDLYRFFKLYPNRKDFEDIFASTINIPDSWILQLIMDKDILKQNIAEYFFEKQYYERALPVFKILSGIEKSFEITEKIGFCYQKLGQYNEALRYYKRAELFDKNKLWLLKKIAFCHRKLGNFKEALSVYEEVNMLEPDNLVNTLYLGQLHIDLEEYDNALKYYYKVEYMENSNQKVDRPIAWCSFIIGKFDNAVKYMEKVIKKNATKDDYMNYGHMLWCKGEVKKAADMYYKSYIASGEAKDWFIYTMRNDRKYLTGKGVDEVDVSIMIDSIIMQI